MARVGGSSAFLGALLFCCCLFLVATITQTPNERLAKKGKGGVEVNVWLIRHGSREDWEEPNWKETSKYPHDPALSPMGIQQAQELAQFLKSQNVTLDEVYSSPFLRTLQTCAIVLDEMKVTEKKVRVENGLSEWFHRGETLSYMSLEELFKLPFLLDRIDQSYQPILKERPQLETPKGLHIRAKNFVQRLTDVLQQTAVSATAAAAALTELENEISFEEEDSSKDNSEGKSDFFSESYDVLLVSHAAPIIALARAFVGDIEAQLAPGTCTLTKLTKVLSRSPPSPPPPSCPPWKMILNSESSFLSSGNYKPFVFQGEIQKQVTDAQE